MLGWGWKFSSQISRHGEEIIKQKILVYLENPQQPHSDIYFDVLQVFNQCFYLWALASKEFLFIWKFLCVTQQLFSIAVRSWYQITNSWWNLSWFILLQEWSRFSHELLMLSSQTRFCCQNILYFSVWSYEPITDYNLLNIELKLLLCHQILSFMTFWRQDVSDLNIFHSIIMVRVATVAAFFSCFCSSKKWQSVRELLRLKSLVEVISLHIICPHSCSEQHFTLLWHRSRSSQTSCSQQYNASTAPCFTSQGNGSFIIVYSRL